MSQSINPHTGKPFSVTYDVVHERARALSIAQHMEQLLQSIADHRVTIIMSDTGIGKSTQTPQYILERFSDFLSGRWIGLTQPRRLVAHEVAARIAVEMDVQLGTVVGLKYKDTESSSNETRILVETDGMTLAKAKGDVSLGKYGMVIIDEAHQHTIPSDLLLGLLKSLLVKRKDLKIVIMSATMDANLFAGCFPGSKIEEVLGRRYAIDYNYLLEPPSDMTNAIVLTIMEIATSGVNAGDILVFVSGVPEINKVIEKVENMLSGPNPRHDPEDIDPLECYPLHSKWSFEDQQRAINSIEPMPRHGRLGRKVIVSTNIAETSVTIDGITHVIDSGEAKYRFWNPIEETWTLRAQPISQAESKQRFGRSGRQSEGTAWAMYTERGAKEDMMEHAIAPILMCDIMAETLHIMKLGFSVTRFDFVVSPAPETIRKAIELLIMIGAIDRQMRLTQRGEQISSLPVDVSSALTILESVRFGCSDEVLSINLQFHSL